VDIDASKREAMGREELALPQDKVLLLVAGRLGPTKRVEVVLRALASEPALRREAFLVIAGGGDADHLAYLRALAGELGIGKAVRFVPDPDDATMHSLIVNADVCVTLRNPSTESASAALTEQLHLGKAVVVTRTGLYDRLPDDVVLKTDPDDEVASVSAALLALVHDPGLREAYGLAASRWAGEHVSPHAYAADLVAFLRALPERGAMLARVDAAAGALARELAGVTSAEMRARVSAAAAGIIQD
jgi:glycosyltransferase involved in cell wall biosynthesis